MGISNDWGCLLEQFRDAGEIAGRDEGENRRVEVTRATTGSEIRCVWSRRSRMPLGTCQGGDGAKRELQ